MSQRVLVMPGGLPARGLALAVLAALAAIVLLFAVLPAAEWMAQRQGRLQHLAAALRLRQAEAAALPALQRDAARSPTVPAGLLTGRDADEAGDDLETRVRRHAGDAGVALLSTDLVQAGTENGLRRLLVEARFEGGYENMLRFCASLGQDSAVLSLARLSIKPAALATLTGSRQLSVAVAVAGFAAPAP